MEIGVDPIVRLERGVMRGVLRPVILSLLDKTTMHGYQIVKSIEKITGFKMSISTIYTILGELEKKGLIKRVGHQNGKTFYTITREGKRILEGIRVRLKKRLDRVMELLFS